MIHNKLLMGALETEAEKNIIDLIRASLANVVQLLCVYTQVCMWINMHVFGYMCI